MPSKNNMNRRHFGIALTLTVLLALLLWWLRGDALIPNTELASTPKQVADTTTTETDAPNVTPQLTPPAEIDTELDEEIPTPDPIDYTTGGTIQGSVSDALTNLPIEDFFLLLKRGQFLNYNPRKHRGFRAHHDPLGIFFLNDLPAEGLTVFVRADGYEPDLRYLPGVRHDIAVTDVDFRLNPVASLIVAVADNLGQPIQDAKVILAEWEKTRWEGMLPESNTDVQGLARFPKVKAGLIPITVVNGGLSEEYSETIVAGQENVAKLVFDGVAPLRGRVLYDGQPWSNVGISLNRERIVCDSEGYFAFENVPTVRSFRVIFLEFPHLRFNGTINRSIDRDSVLINVPRFNTGMKLDLDIGLGEDEHARVFLRGSNMGEFSIMDIKDVSVESKYEISPIPSAEYSISVEIRREQMVAIVFPEANLSLMDVLRPGLSFAGTLHGNRSGSDIVNLSITGNYVPL